MTEDPHFEDLEPSAPMSGGSGPGADLRRLRDVLVELTVEIGRTHMTVGETLELRPGSVVALERMAGEPVDLLVNGSRIARGEVVIVDEEFGLRITEIGAATDAFTPSTAADATAQQSQPSDGELLSGQLIAGDDTVRAA
jgi:flagellar motor switch protein FliN/FliY